MKKGILLILVTMLFLATAFAQRKTTNVKSYYRKDGTYVSAHTRGYTAGSSSTYASTGGTSTAKSDEEEIAATTLKLITLNQANRNTNKESYPNARGQKVVPTTLIFPAVVSTDSSSSSTKYTNEGIVFYVSVLRYNGKTIDICPIPRERYSGWDFTKVAHKFDKKFLTTEDTLELIAKYGWRIDDDEMSKDFSYSYGDKGFPKYLTKSIEAIKVQ